MRSSRYNHFANAFFSILIARTITYVIYIRVEKTIDCCEKGPYKRCCARLLFRFSYKNQDRLSICSKTQGIYIGKLDA